MTAGAFAAMALVLAGGQATQPTDADWAWLDQAREAAFESLMPLGVTSDLIVTYFSYRDLYYEEPEAYFSIRSNPRDLSPSAHVVTPLGASVQKQLLQMHMDDRSATVPDLISRVKVSHTQVSASTCGAVRRAVEAMLKLPPPEPDRDLLVIHPRVHRMIRVRDGQTIDLSLVNDYHPLVVWAGRSLAELQRCRAAK